MSNINSNEIGNDLIVEFCEKDQNLQPYERKQLHKFYKGQCDRNFFSLVLCVGVGLVVPSVVKTNSSGFAIFGFLMGCASHRLLSDKLCELHLEKFKRDVGEKSNVFEIIKLAPDLPSLFSDYYRDTSINPNIRARVLKSIKDSSNSIPIEEKIG